MLVLASLVSSLETWTARKARLRMCAYACDLVRASGTDPASPVDPFTGKPFAVRKGTPGWLLASPGPDEVDEAYQPEDFAEEEPDDVEDDIHFLIPRSALPLERREESAGEEKGK